MWYIKGKVLGLVGMVILFFVVAGAWEQLIILGVLIGLVIVLRHAVRGD